MGGFEPSAERFRQLTACATADEHRSSGTPYPFYLASPWNPNDFWRHRRAIGNWNGNGMESAVS